MGVPVVGEVVVPPLLGARHAAVFCIYRLTLHRNHTAGLIRSPPILQKEGRDLIPDIFHLQSHGARSESLIQLVVVSPASTSRST